MEKQRLRAIEKKVRLQINRAWRQGLCGELHRQLKVLGEIKAGYDERLNSLGVDVRHR